MSESTTDSTTESTPADEAAEGGAGNVEKLLSEAVSALGGSRRDGQVRMTRAVHGAFANERHLAVQAGTGTGKSLAYLVPAIDRAMSTDSTVIVSTATIALQRQLVDRDLPRLTEALTPHLKRKPTFAILKGRNNYLCQRKLGETPEDDGQEEIIDEAQLSLTAKHVMRLREWAQETETGDRDSLEKGVLDQAWRQVSVTSRECVGATRCPFGDTCFAEVAKMEASEVDVVVTNHAMLAIDAMSDSTVLPEHDCVVIDEAHELEGRITSMSTEDISPAAVTVAVRRARKLGADEQIADVEEAMDMLRETLGSLPDDHIGRWIHLPDRVGDALVAVRQALWNAQTALQTSQQGDASERQAVRVTFENLHDTVVRILAQVGGDDSKKNGTGPDVVWMTDNRVISVAPLSVAEMLRNRLFSESTVVLASATLALGGNFGAMAASWGLPKNSWDSMDVGTPFEPGKSGILYTARHLPKPGRTGADPAVYDEIEALIRAAGGRTLGLFSSRRGAEMAAEEMRKRLPFDVLCQGEDSTGNLVDKFAASENTCLFGTLTLWQGVDVPGPSLSLVLIDRIPFPRPDDPLLSARADAADAAGRSGFMEVSATHAALLLAQGAGRLLRSVGDRGVVAVLDPRLSTARYGPWLAASMPPFWRTTNKKVALGALERLVQARHKR